MRYKQTLYDMVTARSNVDAGMRAQADNSLRQEIEKLTHTNPIVQNIVEGDLSLESATQTLLENPRQDNRQARDLHLNYSYGSSNPTHFGEISNSLGIVAKIHQKDMQYRSGAPGCRLTAIGMAVGFILPWVPVFTSGSLDYSGASIITAPIGALIGLKLDSLVNRFGKRNNSTVSVYEQGKEKVVKEMRSVDATIRELYPLAHA